MIISAIAAIDRRGLIGDGTRMPWHLPLDLRRFRDRTLGKPVIMGRHTFDSLAAPLPGRLNIILSHSAPSVAAGCRLARSIDEALRFAEDYCGQVGGNEAMIIGGGRVYEATALLWSRLLLTVVEGDFAGDVYFPVDRVKEARWMVKERVFLNADARNRHPHWYLALERREQAAPDLGDFDLDAWLKGPRVATAQQPITPLGDHSQSLRRPKGASILRVELEGGPADGKRVDVPEGVPRIFLDDQGSAGSGHDPFEGQPLGRTIYEITERIATDGARIFIYVEQLASE